MLLLIASITAVGVAHAEQLDFDSPNRPRIGLVLSGGGARGAAHIGVLTILEELHVPIDVIVGTSMGALVGGAYASGMPLAEMRQRVSQIRTADIVRDEMPRTERSERSKRDEQGNFIGPTFGFRDGTLSLPKGAVSGIGLDALLRDFVQQQREVEFDRLPIPFRAVATDIETGQMHVLDSGSLASAMRASISIPGLFAPVEIDGRMLVDGGLTRNLPVDVAREMGVDIVIAVNLGTPLLRRDQVTSLVGVTAQMINILTEQNVRDSVKSLQKRDILISPELNDFSASDFDHMNDVVEIGETATRAVTLQLQRLAVTRAQYLNHRTAQRRVPPPEMAPSIDEIRFTGLKRANPAVLSGLVQTQVGRPVDAATLDADISRIYGRGDFDRVSYQLVPEQSKHILVIDAEESPAGEDSLRFGLGLSNDFAGNAHFQALVRHRRNWLNSLGAQWRTDLLIGRTNRLTTELHQPLTIGQSLFIAPYVDLEQKPLDIFDRSNRIARFSRQSGIVGLDFGAQVGRLGEVRMGVFRGRRSFQLDTGPSSLVNADDSIDIGGAKLHLRSDQLDSRTFPRNGQSLSVDILASSPSLGARDRYARWNAEYLAAFSQGDHTLQFGLQGGGPIGANRLPTHDLFQFGGLMQLSGLRTGQLMGQSLVFGRAVYARRLDSSSWRQGLFGGFSVEAGRVADPLLPNNQSGLITAASLFLALDTPIGPVYIGLGRAREGSSALYLYLGVP